MLEGRVECHLQQQVLGRGQPGELAAAGAAAFPEPPGVGGEEAGRRDDAAVELQDLAAARVAEGPRVVPARHLHEARLAQDRDRLRPALEGEEVHVGHRAVGLDVVDGLGEHHTLERQGAQAARLEEREAPGGEADLAEGANEQGSPPRAERLRDRLGPGRPLALDRREEEPGNSLIARGFGERGRGKALRKSLQPARGHEGAQQAPRF